MKNSKNLSGVKEGTFFSRSSFGQILAVKKDGFEVKNKDGKVWFIETSIAAEEMVFSGVYDTTLSVSRQEVIEKILKNPAKVMSVTFHKQLTKNDFVDKMKKVYPNNSGKILSLNDFTKQASALFEEITLGEKREMVGYHYGSINEVGRLMFYDMENNYEIRLVDTRTVESLILENIRYNVK